MKTRKRILIYLFFIAIAPSLRAQVVLSTLTLNAGGNYQNTAEVRLTSSIGEMAEINTITVSDLMLSGGVLQPPLRRSYYDSTASASDVLLLYPTITNGHIFFIEARSAEPMKGTVNIYTSTGQIINRQTVSVSSGIYKQSFSLPPYRSGEFIVEVILQATHITVPYRRVFKIQKF